MRIEEIGIDSPYLDKVKLLGRANASTLGFFPDGAFNDHALRRQIIVAIDSKNECIGYLLYRVSRSRAVIVHLCIEKFGRGNGVAKKLVEHLIEITKHYQSVSLKCRREYEANKLWPKCKFIAIGEQPGRGKDSGILTIWRYDHGHPTLFTKLELERPSSDFKAVIDANVFFDLRDSARSGHEESSALTADWLPNLELCLTDEILNEINNNKDDNLRRRNKEAASRYVPAISNRNEYNAVESRLSELLPKPKTSNDESDFRQLCYTISAGIKFFITRDEGVLAFSDIVYDEFKVTIIRPSDFIIHLDELRRENDYQPARFAGTLSEIRLIKRGDENELVAAFLSNSRSESKSQFQSALRSLLADPQRYVCRYVIGEGKKPLGMLAYDKISPHELTLPFLRIARVPGEETLARHLIFQAILSGSGQNRKAIRITDNFLSKQVVEALTEDHFIQVNDGWLKPTLSVIDQANGLVRHINECKISCGLQPESFSDVIDALQKNETEENVNLAVEIEKFFWPAKISNSGIPTFIVPIRPEWAKDLFDEKLANQILFGAKPELALNRESVYYRSAINHGGLKSPGRILWYVSDGNGYDGVKSLRACSRLDDVVVGNPKDLFRRFKRLGIYEWKNVFEIAKQKSDSLIMALRFSDTELFSNPIGLKQLNAILRQEGIRTQFQSPVFIPSRVFAELYRQGNQFI